MFCPKCGKELKDSSHFCVHCGVALDEAKPQAGQSDQTSGPAYENSGIDLNPVGEGHPKKHMGKKGRLAIIISSAVVVAVVVALVLCWGSIQNLFARNGAPEEYLKTVEMNSVESLSGNLTSTYDAILKPLGQEKIGAEYQMKLKISPQILAAMQASMQQSVLGDLSFLENISMDVSSQAEGNLYACNMSFSLSDSKIMTIEMVVDAEQMKVWYRIPELSDQFLYADLAELLKAGGMNPQQIMAQFQNSRFFADLAAALPDGRTLSGIVERYAGIVLDSLSHVEKREDTLVVEDISQDCIVLKATVSQADAMQIIEKVIKEFKNDKELLGIFRNFCDVIAKYDNMPGDSGEEAYNIILESLDETLEKIERTKEHADPDKVMVYESYVDNSGAVIGRSLRLPNSCEICWYQAENDGKFAEVLQIEDLKLSGSGTVDGDQHTGTYDLMVGDEAVVRLKIENFAAKANGRLTGSLSIMPSRELSDQIAAGSRNPAISSILSTLSLKMDFEDDGGTISINAAGMMLMGVEMHGGFVPGQGVTVPVGGLNINNEDEILQWMQSISFDKVVVALKKAGLPDEFLSGIMQFEKMLESQLRMHS